MAQTTPREALTCVAISYFCENRNSTTIEDFSNIVYKYFFENDEQDITKLKLNLQNQFDFKRIKDLFSSKQIALTKDSSYVLSAFKKDFSENKEYSSEDGSPTKLDVEIKSAYSIAKVLQNTPIIGNLSQYKIYDQASDFMKIVKDDALKNTLNALKMPKEVGSDILSSVDIILVKKSKEKIIVKDFEENISGDIDEITILNNLAYGDKGKNTFRTLTNKYFFDKDMVGISLKKVPTNRDANIKIIGTIAGARGELKIYLDPYTEFLGKVEATKSRTELYNLIDDLVEVTEIKSTDPRAYFSVNYKLKYKDVDITDKVVKINLQIGRSGFNAGEGGKLGFVGGASYSVTLPILERYPRYNEMVREVKSIREKAFKFAIDEKKISNNLKTDYNKVLRVVNKNTLVLYETSDNQVIKNFCQKYDSETKNTKDSFQEYRMGVSKLCKNKSLKSNDNLLKALDTESFKISGVPKTLHNDYVHAQGLWMYTRQKEDLKKYFKKQISLTLYGIMSKKGSKVFYSKQKGVFSEEAFVKEFKTKNNKTKLAKVVSAPYLLID